MALENNTVDTAGLNTTDTDLNFSITQANSGDNVTATLSGDITEAGPVTSIDLTPSGGTLLIDGSGDTLTGQATGAAPTLTITSGDVTIEALTIAPGAAGTIAVQFPTTGASLTAAEITFAPETGEEPIVNSAVTGVIAGVGSIVVDAGAVVTLSAANTYTGHTIVGGTLDLTGAGSIAGSHNVNVGADGVLDITGVTAATTINELTGVGGSVDLGDNTLTINENVVNGTFAGGFNGNGDSHLVINGPDSLTLTAASTGVDEAPDFGGHLSINTDVLLSGAGSVADAHNVALQAATGELDISGLTNANPAVVTPSTSINELTGVAGSIVNLGANDLSVIENITTTTAATFSGTFEGTGALSIFGPESLTLTAASTDYTGALSIDTDIILTGAGSIAQASSVALDDNFAPEFSPEFVVLIEEHPGELDISGITAPSGTPSTSINNLTGVDGSVVELGANSLTVNETVAGEFDGAFDGSGHLTLSGTAALTLGGDSAGGDENGDDFTGHLTINTDVILVGEVSIADAHNVALGATGELDVTSAVDAVSINELTGVAGSIVELGANDLTVNENVTTAAAATFAGTFDGSGDLTIDGPDSLTLTGDSAGTDAGVDAFTGHLIVDTDLILSGAGSIATAHNVALGATGTLDVSALATASINELTGVAGSVVNLGAGSLTVDENDATVTGAAFAGVFEGTGLLTLDGPESLTLTGANTGFTGHLAIDTDVILGAGGSIAAAHNVTLGATGELDTSSLSATTSVSINELTGVAGSVVAVGSNTLTVHENVQNATFAGAFTSGGLTNGHLVIDGPDSLTLTGQSTFNGHLSIDTDVILSGTGTIAVTSDVALQATTSVLDVTGVTGGAAAITQLSGVTGSKVLLGATDLTVTETKAATFSGVISGSGDLAVTGAGALTLATTQTYTGTTTVGGDATLALGPNGSIADSSGVVVNDGGTLSFVAAEDPTGGAVNEQVQSLTGTGGTVALGTNSLTITGTDMNPFAGSITGGATNAGGTPNQGSVTVAAGADLALSGDSTYTGKTIVDGTLTLEGTGPVDIISGSHNVTLGAAGVLNVDMTPGALPPVMPSIFHVDIPVGPGSTIINELTGVAGSTVNLEAGTLIVNENVAPASFSGLITGAGNFELTGADSLTLSSAETFTGTTTVDGGATLILGANGALVDSVQVDVSGTLDLSGAAASNTLNAFTGTGSILLGANTLVAANGGDFEGVISGAGNLQVGAGAGPAFNNGSELTLSGDSTYTGKTVIFGSLELDGDGAAIADSHNVSLAGSNAELSLESDQTIHELSGVAGSTVDLGNSVLTIFEDVKAATFSGTITDDASDETAPGSLIVAADSGTPFTLTLNGANDYSGSTTIEAGATLALGTSGSLGGNFAGIGDDAPVSFTTVFGTLDISGAGGGAPVVVTNLTSEDANGAAGTVILGANTLEDAIFGEEGTVSTFAGVISGSGGLTVESGDGDGGALVLTGANTYTGTTTVTSEGEQTALILEGTLATSNIVVNDGGEFDLEVSGAFNTAVTGNGGFFVGKADRFGVSVTNAPTVTVTNALANFTGVVGVAGSATLVLGAGGSIANADQVVVEREGTLDLSSAAETVAISSLFVAEDADVLLGANTLELTTGSSFIAGTITGSGGLQVDGGATITLGGESGGGTFTGKTVISGLLEVESADQLSSSHNVSLRTGGVLDINTATVINELTGQTNTMVNLDAGLTVNENLAAAGFSGVIAGGGSFTLEGTDTLSLLGDNTFTGATTIDAGSTLAIGAGGSIADSTAVVVTGTLDLTGAGATSSLIDLSGTGSVILGATALTVTENGFGTGAADTFSGVISGTGSLAVDGTTTVTPGSPTVPSTGTSTHLVLSGANTFSGGLTIAGGTVELATAASAGTGTITFHDGATGVGVLQVDALTPGAGGTQTLANTITGLSAATGTGGDIIDLANVTFETGATATYNNSTNILTLTDGNATVTLHVTGVPAGDQFAAYADSHGGTFLVLEAGAPTTQAAYEASHFHP